MIDWQNPFYMRWCSTGALQIYDSIVWMCRARAGSDSTRGGVVTKDHVPPCSFAAPPASGITQSAMEAGVARRTQLCAAFLPVVHIPPPLRMLSQTCHKACPCRHYGAWLVQATAPTLRCHRNRRQCQPYAI